MSNYGGRKFILAILALLSATVLCWTRHIADGVYSAVLLGTVCAYLASNVTQKATAKDVVP